MKTINFLFVSFFSLAFIVNADLYAGATGLFNTGTAGNPNIGDQDPAWTIISAPPPLNFPSPQPSDVGPAVVIVPNGSAGYVDPTDSNGISKWIGPYSSRFADSYYSGANPGGIIGSVSPSGAFVYSLNFSVDSPINLGYAFAVDNYVSRVELIGNTTYLRTDFPGDSSTNWSSFASTYNNDPFQINNISPGNYTIQFEVVNAPLDFSHLHNPSGLRVEFTTVDVPEPTTYALLGSIIGLICLKRRKQLLIPLVPR